MKEILDYAIQRREMISTLKCLKTFILIYVTSKTSRERLELRNLNKDFKLNFWEIELQQVKAANIGSVK